MKATVLLEREIAELHAQNKYTAIFQGVDGVSAIPLASPSDIVPLSHISVANTVCLLDLSRSADDRSRIDLFVSFYEMPVYSIVLID